MMIEYKRARRDRTMLSDRKTWTSRCDQYRVQECNNHFEKRFIYYALIRGESGKWTMLQHMRTYRTKGAAEKALLRHHKKGIAAAKAAAKKPRKARRK